MPVTVPVPKEPSPQLIVATKSVDAAAGSAVKFATVLTKGAPATAVIVVPVAVNNELAAVTVAVPLVMATWPLAIRVTVTRTVSLPGCA